MKLPTHRLFDLEWKLPVSDQVRQFATALSESPRERIPDLNHDCRKTAVWNLTLSAVFLSITIASCLILRCRMEDRQLSMMLCIFIACFGLPISCLAYSHYRWFRKRATELPTSDDLWQMVEAINAPKRLAKEKLESERAWMENHRKYVHDLLTRNDIILSRDDQQIAQVLLALRIDPTYARGGEFTSLSDAISFYKKYMIEGYNNLPNLDAPPGSKDFTCSLSEGPVRVTRWHSWFSGYDDRDHHDSWHIIRNGECTFVLKYAPDPLPGVQQ